MLFRSGRRELGGGGSALAAIAELVSSGAGVLAVSADASRRAELAAGAGGLARFNGGAALVACHRCGAAAVAGLADRAAGGLALTDYAALELAPELAADFEHVVLVDPPRGPGDAARASLPRAAGPGGGFLHRLWHGEEGFALAAAEARAPSRATVAAAFRSLREAGEASGARLRAALAGQGPHPRCPETAARCFRVLRELGLVQGEPNGGAGLAGVVSSDRTELERSPAFRAYTDQLAEARTFLASRRQP